MINEPKNYPSRKEAEKIFENVIVMRNATKFPFTEKMEMTFRAHCRTVAMIAEILAKKTKTMNAEKAYVLGLLHDCGRMLDEWNEHIFHGLVGYRYMLHLNYPDVAKICLTHCFYTEDFDPADYIHYKDYAPECREVMRDFKYDDYDHLIALADMMNNMGKTCSINQRVAGSADRYSTTPEEVKKLGRQLHEIKAMFDKKCGKDIYEILHIEE